MGTARTGRRLPRPVLVEQVDFGEHFRTVSFFDLRVVSWYFYFLVCCKITAPSRPGYLWSQRQAGSCKEDRR